MKKRISLGAAALLSVLPASVDVKLSGRLMKIADHLGEGGVHFSVTASQENLKNLAGLLDKVFVLIPVEEIPT